MIKGSLLIATLIAFSVSVHAETAQQGIAMHGAPKYAAGFDHFDYVNPDAPKGGTLRLNANGSFDSTNPFIVLGQPAAYLTLVYESLMARSWDEPFALYGLLAESIDVPDDRSSITFNINLKAKWSDGQPVTSDDVLFSYNTLREKGRPNHRTYYKKVVKAEKLDDHRVKFTFAANANGVVDREMPLIMGLMPILPEHIWKSREFGKTSFTIPVGSGPYTVSKLDPGRSITYTRNPDYWGKDLAVQKGMYNFDQIRVDYYRDESVALEGFKANQFDLRRELNPNRWATSYDFPAVKDGRVKLDQLEHHRPEPAAGFVFNTRRDPFRDPALRAALEYTFDSGWINKNLFHSQYHRTESFFPNSELAAPALPEGREKEVLDKYRAQLPTDIFDTPITPPSTDGTEESLRSNLLKARALLQASGYTWKNEMLYAPDGTVPIAFEILLGDPAEEKIALSWSRMLKRIGIDARVHTVDTSQYQSRLANFDFDVMSYKWVNTLSPGNEQVFFWGSAAADQKGSRNYPGVKDPVIDALAASISATPTREDLVATTHALDRVLMEGHYTIPFFYLGFDDIAYWTAHLRHPGSPPLYGMVMETWWSQNAP